MTITAGTREVRIQRVTITEGRLTRNFQRKLDDQGLHLRIGRATEFKTGGRWGEDT